MDDGRDPTRLLDLRRLETWLTPIEGWIVDSLGMRGAKLMVAFGGVMVATGWGLNAVADQLWILYLAAVISGIGAGGIYATCVCIFNSSASRRPSKT